MSRRPKEETRKKERLAQLADIGIGTVYHYLAGTRRAGIDNAKSLNNILGGGIILWMELGRKELKKELFYGADI